jgi:hypothetical protein
VLHFFVLTELPGDNYMIFLVMYIVNSWDVLSASYLLLCEKKENMMKFSMLCVYALAVHTVVAL